MRIKMEFQLTPESLVRLRQLLSDMAEEVAKLQRNELWWPSWNGRVYTTWPGEGIYSFSFLENDKSLIMICEFVGDRFTFLDGTQFFFFSVSLFPKPGSSAEFTLFVRGTSLQLHGRVVSYRTSRPRQPLCLYEGRLPYWRAKRP